MEAPQISVLTIQTSEWKEVKTMLSQLCQQVQDLTSKDQKELLTATEVCKALKCSRSTYERLMNEGVLPVVKVNKAKGSKNYVRRSDLEEIIKNGKV